MTPETLTIIGTVVTVGVALAGLLMHLAGHLAGRMTRLEDRQITQGERLARLEGKIDRFDPRPPHDHAPAPAGD